MQGEDNRRAVEGLWDAIAVKDYAGATAFMSDDFIEDWPQSGERITGSQNWLSMVTNHPSLRSIKPLRTYGNGDLWVTELDFDYGDGNPWKVCAIHEARDGKVIKITEYFGAPFEAAEWRAAWVGRIEE
jgi:hypothetical protein